ncbi:hypothetical protein [Allocoleopsis franciscana]|nr:hypothetical protein [Allocoleopsis franciscana]
MSDFTEEKSCELEKNFNKTFKNSSNKMAVSTDDQDREGIPTDSIRKDEQDCIGGITVSSQLQENTNQQQSADKQGTDVEPISQPQETNAKATYAEKTNRIQAWVQFIKAVAPFIWGIVILVVIIPLVGQLFIAKAFSTKSIIAETKHPIEVVEQRQVDWSKVNEAMKLTLDHAYNSAEDYASQELDVWVDELMGRVDSSFLDWYFGYFNQKQIEYKSLFVQLSSGASRLLNPNNPTPAEKVAEVITEDFQKEFAKRVLIPQTSQLRLERITQQTVKHYLDDLKGNINSIPLRYNLPQADWERYLNEIAITINDTEGKISNLSLKVLAGGGSYLALKPLVAPLVVKVGSKVVTKLASKAGAKVATKTGAVLASKLGAAVLDCTVGVGIILWDVWDTNHTAHVEKPILRDNLAAYLQEVKYSLLNNRENGIMTVIDQIQSKIVPNLNKLM